MNENFIVNIRKLPRKALLSTMGLIVVFLTKTPGIKYLFATLLKFIAHTGKGSNILARSGVIIYPIHYYYPAPNVLELEKRHIFEKKKILYGIDFNETKQFEFLKSISLLYAKECNFPSEKTHNQEDYYTECGSFSYGCASLLHCIIRKYKPKRIIEVGVGNSSKVINRALSFNNKEGNTSEYIAIDPYPQSYVGQLEHLSRLVAKPVEELDLDLFRSLEENDILFIDSSHQVKIGNDVLFLYLEVLPLLKPGVLVHIHDINLPYEYSKAYFLNEEFRVCWNEQYLLQAFLIHNSNYQILLGAANIMENYLDKFKEAFPLFNPHKHVSASGSFWVQRINEKTLSTRR